MATSSTSGNTPRTSGPRTQRKRPGDLTGVTDQKLKAAVAKQQSQEQEESVRKAAEEREVKLASTISYVHDQEEIVEEEIEVRSKTEFIRVNYPIEEMTYGREVLDPGVFDENEGRWVRAPRLGNLRVYNFEEGPRYEVPPDVADHLRSLGYVYDFD